MPTTSELTRRAFDEVCKREAARRTEMLAGIPASACPVAFPNNPSVTFTSRPVVAAVDTDAEDAGKPDCLVAVRLPRHLLESLDSYVAAVDSDRSKIIRAALRQRIGANTTAA